MKKAWSIAVILSLCLCLCACGGSETEANDPTLGVYNGVACEAFGIYGDIREIYEGECFVELKKNGKCTVTIEGESLSGKYTLEGETINLSLRGTDSPGTLEDGVLCVDFMEMGVNLFFVKEGTDIPGYLREELCYFEESGEIPADVLGDWHGIARCNGGGIYEGVNGAELEIIARFVQDAQGNCIPYIAVSLADGGADNFRDLALSYYSWLNEDPEWVTLVLDGTLLGESLYDSFVLLNEDDLSIYAHIDDWEGNYLDIEADLDPLGADWETDDYPVLSQEAAEYYRGMTLEEIAAELGLDTASMPKVN